MPRSPVHNDFQNSDGIFPLFDGLEARDEDLPESLSDHTNDHSKTNGHINGNSKAKTNRDTNEHRANSKDEERSGSETAKVDGTAAATDAPAGTAPPY